MPTPVSENSLAPDVVLLTVPEAAKLLRIGRTKAWAMVRAGDIPSLQLGRAVRVPRAELLRSLDSITRRKQPVGREGGSRARATRAQGRSPGT
jgi:excisionase family DNA binding protein